MKIYNCIIVEDEPIAVEILKDYISETKELNLQDVFTNAISAMSYLERNKVDLIFLDINLPRLKGLEFLELLKDQPPVIITSAYNEYALDSYKFKVIDYLLKPISFSRFKKAIQKYTELMHLNSTAQISFTDKEVIYLNINRKQHKVILDDIIYIESRREYVHIFTKESEQKCKMTLSEIELLLSKDLFVRIHRSYIVSIKFINSISMSTLEVLNKSLPIGRTYKLNIQKIWKNNT